MSSSASRLADLPVNAAAGSVQDRLGAGLPHRFDYQVGQLGAFAEVDVRLGDGTGNVGIGCQVNDGIVPGHRLAQPSKFVDVGTDDLQAVIGLMVREVPVPAGGEIVIEGDAPGGRIAEEPVEEMTADEPRPTSDEVGAVRHNFLPNRLATLLGSVARNTLPRSVAKRIIGSIPSASALVAGPGG